MISTVAWIPRGASSRRPHRQELSAEEFEALKQQALIEAGEDNDDENNVADDIDEVVGNASSTIKSKNSKNNKTTLPSSVENAEDEEEDDNDEENDDLEAKPFDSFIAVANTEDEFSSLEIHCYNEQEGSLYVHHDIQLPSFPLALAWSDYAGNAAGNLYIQTGQWNGSNDAYVGSYCAVGSFDPNIEIWNLDVLDPLEPTLILKGAKVEKKKKTKKNKKNKSSSSSTTTTVVNDDEISGGNVRNPDGHTDAVMGLGWNFTHRNLLASSSADHTVKVWDLDDQGTVIHTFHHHKNKVQSVAWNPVEHSVLASASFDRTVAITDAREGNNRVARYGLPAEPESFTWNHLAPETFLVAMENGYVICYDCRSPDKALWSLKAHDQAVNSVSLSSTAGGLLATASLDKTVKLWDIQTLAENSSSSSSSSSSASSASTNPALIGKKAMSIGQIFTCSFYPNNPYLLACGGSKGMLAIWDISEDGGDLNTVEGENPVTNRFAGRIQEPQNVPTLALRKRHDGQTI